MRVTYILAVIIAATRHASGTALPATKNSNVLIENVGSPGMVNATEKDGGRLLRVEKNAADHEEDRSFKEFGKFMKKEILQSIPFTKAWKKHKEMNKLREQAATAQHRRDNIKYASQ